MHADPNKVAQAEQQRRAFQPPAAAVRDGRTLPPPALRAADCALGRWLLLPMLLPHAPPKAAPSPPLRTPQQRQRQQQAACKVHPVADHHALLLWGSRLAGKQVRRTRVHGREAAAGAGGEARQVVQQPRPAAGESGNTGGKQPGWGQVGKPHKVKPVSASAEKADLLRQSQQGVEL